MGGSFRVYFDKTNQTMTLNGSTPTSTYGAMWNLGPYLTTARIVPGHTYIAYIKVISGVAGGNLRIMVDGSGDYVANYSTIHKWTLPAGLSGSITNLYANKNTIFNNVIIKPMFIDLTRMYGAGNEPATLADFRKQYPCDYYPYNEFDFV